MKSLPLSEAKNRFSEVIAWVESGQEVEVTRRGVRIAKVTPVEADTSVRANTLAAFAAIDAIGPISLEGDLKVIAREGLA
jgi:prevent-host-death family protein